MNSMPAETAFVVLALAALLIGALLHFARRRGTLVMFVASIASLGVVMFAFQTGAQMIATGA